MVLFPSVHARVPTSAAGTAAVAGSGRGSVSPRSCQPVHRWPCMINRFLSNSSSGLVPGSSASASIHWCILHTARARRGGCASPAATRLPASSNSLGRSARGRVPRTARRRTLPPTPGTAVPPSASASMSRAWMRGRTSSVTRFPLRSRSRDSSPAARTPATHARACSSRRSDGSDPVPATSTSQVQATTASWREGPPRSIGATAWTSMPTGSAASRRRHSSSPSSTSPAAPTSSFTGTSPPVANS